MKGYRGSRNLWTLIALLLILGVIGGCIGVLLQPVIPFAGKNLLSLGVSSFTLDLLVLSITFGCALKINLITIIGFIIAIFIYFRP